MCGFLAESGVKLMFTIPPDELFMLLVVLLIGRLVDSAISNQWISSRFECTRLLHWQRGVKTAQGTRRQDQITHASPSWQDMAIRFAAKLFIFFLSPSFSFFF